MKKAFNPFRSAAIPEKSSEETPKHYEKLTKKRIQIKEMRQTPRRDWAD